MGFRVDTADEIKASRDAWALPPRKIDSLPQYLGVLVGFISDMANKIHLHKNDWHRTVFLDAGGVRAMDLSLSDDAIRMLVENGRTFTRDYFRWFEDPAAAEPPINRL